MVFLQLQAQILLAVGLAAPKPVDAKPAAKERRPKSTVQLNQVYHGSTQPDAQYPTFPHPHGHIDFSHSSVFCYLNIFYTVDMLVSAKQSVSGCVFLLHIPISQ